MSTILNSLQIMGGNLQNQGIKLVLNYGNTRPTTGPKTTKQQNVPLRPCKAYNEVIGAQYLQFERKKNLVLQESIQTPSG